MLLICMLYPLLDISRDNGVRKMKRESIEIQKEGARHAVGLLSLSLLQRKKDDDHQSHFLSCQSSP